MFFNLEIFNKDDYKSFLDKIECVDDKKNKKYYYNSNNYSKKFYNSLLNLSNNHCFYCGEKLISNNKNRLYFEREHIIDKKIFEEKTDEYKLIAHCKKNLIPVCKTCNSIKSFKNKLEVRSEIPKSCDCKTNCLNIKILSETYNFCYFDELKFDYLNLQYFSNNKANRIINLDLNNRAHWMFEGIFEFLYDNEIKISKNKRESIYPHLTNNIIEEIMLEFIEENKLLNTHKLKNLIETITLLNI